MYSKVSRYMMAAVLAVSSVGCSEFLSGEKAKPEVIEFSDARFACLQKLPLHLKNFSVGDAQEADIQSSFDCMTEALKYFNKRTFGSVSGSYTVEEMRRFFGKYFLKQNNVSPEFAAELMKIKRALVGGSTQYITKAEIVAVVEILGVLREEVIDLSPHVKILLNQTTQKKAEWESISTATEQLRRSMQRLLEKTQIAKSDYSFDDAKKVLAGFASFIKGDENFAPYDRYSQWMPMVEAVKNVLMGRRANFSGLHQWSESLDTLMDLYELVLKYHYSLSDLEFNDPTKLRQMSQFVGQGLKLISESHQMKTAGYIPLQDLDILIEQTLPNLGISVQAMSVKKVYRAVLIKMLDPERKSDSRGLLGLERKHIATLQREFNVWRLQQSFIDNIPYGSAWAVTQKQLVEAYQRFDKTYVIEKGLSDDPYEQKALESSWEDLGELVQAPMPVMFNKQGRLVIDNNGAEMGQTWSSLTKGNLMRALSRMLTIGYGDSVTNKMKEAGISQNGLISWYEEFRPIFLDIGAFDPRSGNSGGRSFLEANFFTFSGNGDDRMEQKETYEFVSILFAAGLSTSESLRQGMVDLKCGVAQKDVFGKPFLVQSCFQKQLKNNFAKYFENMPGMTAYVQGLNQAQWDQFFGYLLAVSATPDQKEGYVETANIRTMVTILHYIESLVVTFDTDKNQALSLNEVYAAAPRFMSFLRTVGGTNSESFLQEGFAYLVFKGSIPGAADLAGFQFSKMVGLGEAQRMQILRIFGTLKDQLNKPKN